MSESFSIRTLEARDVDAFLSLYGRAFPDKYITPKTWARIVDEPATVWLCECAGIAVAPVAFLYFWTVADEFQIIDIGVLPDFRRRGLAKALLQRLLENAFSENKKITLEVRVGNVNAIQLYESLSFERVGLREHYYANGDDAVLYEWPMR